MVNVKDKINIRGLIRQLKRKGYVVYDKPYQLNIVGVRSDNTKPNKFDDLIYVFWKTDKGFWKGKAYPRSKMKEGAPNLPWEKEAYSKTDDYETL